MEHFRGFDHLSAFQSGCVATSSTVGAKTCRYLYDKASVGSPTGERLISLETRERPRVCGAFAMPNFIPLM